MAVNSTMMPLGTTAPEFQLPDPNGALHGTADVAGAPGLLVAFVCNHCPYVVHVGPKLGELTAHWAEQGLAILAVNANDVAAYPDDAPEHMVTFAEKNGWDFPYLYDETQEVAKAYRAACTPDLFLFDRDRRLVYRGQFDSTRPSSGVPATGADLDAAVQALLSSSPVPADQMPSAGCNIKWRAGNEPDYAR